MVMLWDFLQEIYGILKKIRKIAKEHGGGGGLFQNVTPVYRFHFLWRFELHFPGRTKIGSEDEIDSSNILVLVCTHLGQGTIDENTDNTDLWGLPCTQHT